MRFKSDNIEAEKICQRADENYCNKIYDEFDYPMRNIFLKSQ